MIALIWVLLWLLFQAIAVDATSRSLRTQWAKTAGLTITPNSVIIMRVCGTPSADHAQPIAAVVCNEQAEAMALACLDIQKGFICHNGMWYGV